MSMKRILTVLAAAALLLSLAACSLPGMGKASPQAVPVYTPEPSAAPTPEPTPEIKPMDIYAPVIEKYVSAAASRMTAENLMNSGLNYMAAYCYGDSPADRLGYCTYDLDSDGTPELLIGSKTSDPYQDKIVLEMFTIRDGAAVRVFTSGERDRYYLRSDGTIANETSSSAYDSGFRLYSFSGGALNAKEAVLFDMAANRDAPWFLEISGVRQNIGDEAANARITEMQSGYVIVDYTPLSSFRK